MSARIALPSLPRLHGPGLHWLPPVWRRRATWRTVARFVAFGPLVGGAPYVIFVFPIPFAYAIGAGPALLAGLLFAAWYHGHAGRPPGWAWRALIGALCGAAAAAAAAGWFLLASTSPDGFMVRVIALHGVPAAVVMALLQRPPVSA